ncbi:heterokaryon incompatibility protein-domain-containing protein, partial [Bombardia bombarda]
SEVRLVKLLPAKFDDPIQCKLEHVSLASAPSFIALSYTWGDSTVTAPVQLHDEEYPATSNLRSFLRHMQSLLGDPGVYLWIDAICINQLDTQERNRQVARMSHIYKSASSLFIWL